MSRRREPQDRSRRRAVDIGLAIVFGAMVGVLVFAFTGNPAFIWIGAGAGILIAAVWNMMT